MYLEEVRINGFKSYATEVQIHFKPGIGVIIGSNGAGKSNILDAIAWTLGENDLRRLRCYSYLDLLFCGSEDYPPAEVARVYLAIRLGRDKKAHLVNLGREIRRDGKERFFYNGEELTGDVYRHKVNELGLGASSKTLIRQEEINNFLHLSPSERFRYLCFLFHPVTVDKKLLSKIKNNFENYFNILIPEGKANMLFSENGGIIAVEVEVAFPGRDARNSLLLSGGEKTVCSLALNLAIFEELNSPFYLFDEVEPSLDWTNHHHMQRLLKSLAGARQLIMVTHLRSTIELADTVHGIRNRKDGTSFAKFYFQMDERILRAYKCC